MEKNSGDISEAAEVVPAQRRISVLLRSTLVEAHPLEGGVASRGWLNWEGGRIPVKACERIHIPS